MLIGRPTTHNFKNKDCPIKLYADRFFVTADMIKKIVDNTPLSSLSKKNAMLDTNLS